MAGLFSRVAHRLLATAAVVALGAMGTIAALPVPTARAADDAGSQLTNETFEGATVPDARWLPLGAACLTAAPNVAPPGEGSQLGYCVNRTDSPSSTTPGYLQLTDNRGSQTGTVLFNRAIPAGAGLDIEFTQYQYNSGSTGLGPADGIGFFLTDGAYTLDTPGPTGASYGGALGYASIKNGEDPVAQPGIAQGYLAVGLDVYGNFSSQPYVGTSCTADSSRQQNRVVLRGPGNGTQGYCIVKQSEPISLSGNSIAGGARLVRVLISPTTSADPFPTVTVFVNGTQVLSASMTEPMPSTVKFGFSASTGGGHEVHLVRLTTVKTVNSLGSIDLVKSVDRHADGGTSATVFTAGDNVPYRFLVTNPGLEALHDIAVTDPQILDINCPDTTLVPQDSLECTGTYGPLTDEQARAGHFVNTATVTGVTESDETVTASSTVTIPTYTQGRFSVTKGVSGTGAELVDTDATFTVNYSYQAGVHLPANAPDGPHRYDAGAGTLTVTSGQTVTSGLIPSGAVVTLSEANPDDPEGATWQHAEFSTDSVRIGDQGTTVQVALTNQYDRRTGVALWAKQDESGAPLAGSQWQLTGPEGGSSTTQAIADCVGENLDACADMADKDYRAGMFKVQDLPWGTYTLHESVAPVGYALDAQKHTEAMTGDGAVADFGVIVNTRLDPASITLSKRVQSTTGEDLGPAQGWALRAVLDPASADGVEISDAAAHLTDGNGTAAAWTVTFPTQDARAQVRATEQQQQGHTFASLSCTVTPAQGQVQTTISGVRDLDAWAGLQLEPGDVAACQLINRQLPGTVAWAKVAQGGDDRLAGSTWTLTGPEVPENTVVADCVAEPCASGAYLDQDPAPGEFLLSDLAWGDYTIVEKAAPAGYHVSTDALRFVIGSGESGSSLAVDLGDIENTPITPPTLPLTGGLGRDVFTYLGAGLLLAAATWLLLVRRRRAEA